MYGDEGELYQSLSVSTSDGDGEGVAQSCEASRGASGCELEDRFGLRFEGVDGSGLRNAPLERSVSGAGADDERR